MNDNPKSLADGHEMIARILAQPNTATGADFNDLMSLFNEGLPLERLKELLQSDNEHIVLGGLFIVQEITDMAAPVLNEVVRQTQNANARVRSSAFAAVFALCCTSKAAFFHVFRGLHDPELQCRKTAAVLTVQARDAWIKSALGELQSHDSSQELQDGLSLLAGPLSQDPVHIAAWIADHRSIIRKCGVIAAARVGNSQLLEIAERSNDEDICQFSVACQRLLAIWKRRPK